MTAPTERVLFSWSDVEFLPDLARLRMVMDNLPDGGIVAELERVRGRGRDDHPVRAMWRACLARLVFQHQSDASFLRELGRNPALLEICGFNPLGRQSPPRRKVTRSGGRLRCVEVASPWRSGAPSEFAFSRFCSAVVKLEKDGGMASAMVDALRRSLTEALPDFCKFMGADGKAIASHSTGRKVKGKGRPSDPDAGWGAHAHRSVDRRTGKLRESLSKWFGYKLHLIADTGHELPVAFSLERAGVSERKVLPRDLRALLESEPQLAGRCVEFSADKGYDQADLKRWLLDDHGIRPIIDTRRLWRDEWEGVRDPHDGEMLRPLNGDWSGNVFHSEKGEVRCQCPETKQFRPMSVQGCEKVRNAVKWRCPAAAYGTECAGREKCSRAAGVSPEGFGRTLRVHLDRSDRRIMTPTPYGTTSWTRGYKRRNALERINARIDDGFRMECHTIRGKAKMTVRVALILSVMMALALGSVKANAPGRMRSLVRAPPIAA